MLKPIATYRSQKTNYSDWLGVTASGLCAIHCALTPLFFAARPILENTKSNHGGLEGFWVLLDYFFLVLSLIAVWYSARHTIHKGIKWGVWIAWIFFAIGLLSEPFDFSYGKWLMYIGSFALIIGHLYNLYYCKKIKHESSRKI